MPREDDIREIAVRHASKPGALTPIMVEINRRLGYVPAEADAIVADILNISVADVAGMVSFYTDFRRTPAGRHVVQVCRAEACQAAGGEALAAEAERRLGCKFGETTPDNATTLDAVYCFGNCALAPALAVDGRLIGRADSAALDRALGFPANGS